MKRKLKKARIKLSKEELSFAIGMVKIGFRLSKIGQLYGIGKGQLSKLLSKTEIGLKRGRPKDFMG